MKYLAIIVIN